ncbi:MAG: GntR family transcriptional regulator [Betaproteobacteria bacterium]
MKPTTASNLTSLARTSGVEGPLYLQLYQQLRIDIREGLYPVRSGFPTEAQLSKQYGVSRHTVREATRKLAEEGLISKQAGSGTVVLASQPAPYVSKLGTFEGAMEYNNTTRLEVLSTQREEASPELADAIRCPIGSVWIAITCMRHPAGQVNPISYSRVYLRPAFAELVVHLHGDHPSVYSLLQQLFGVEVHSIRQRIEATLMPQDAAELLQLPQGNPALHVQRCYCDDQNAVLAASLNWYVPTRFRMEASFLRQEKSAI